MSIDWKSVERVLVVRLRSIGDTVLCTPALSALRNFLPDARIDVLLEDWVAPLLEGFEYVDNVLSVGKSGAERFRAARDIRRQRYDVVFNLHGGTTGTFFAASSGAKHKVGFSYYQYRFLYTDAFPSGEEFWNRPRIHSVEQQLALLGSAGVPVSPPPRTHLAVLNESLLSIERRFHEAGIANSEFVLMHPAAALATKQWATENFARIAEYLDHYEVATVAVASRAERALLDELVENSSLPITVFDDLQLPEITALASKARLFVGIDSGLAHIAAAVDTPPVVIFGSSNRDNWGPWTDAPSEMVFSEFHCQPCSGYRCEEFGEPRCIQSVRVQDVTSAIDRVIAQTEKRRTPPPAVLPFSGL
jgi:ADP-heptose:LPS heptosyltransferase